MSARITIRCAAGALLLMLPATVRAQYEHGYADQTVDLAGPRFGVTVLSGGLTSRLKKDRNISVNPVITQFGWQLEKQFKTGSNDVSALTELVLLVGGMEQNVAIPSLSWIVGARLKSGFEFGVGPNITPLSSAIVYVAGVTHKVGTLNIPVNVSVVPSVDGVRASVLTGFNLTTFDSWPLRMHSQRSPTPPSVRLPSDIGSFRPRLGGKA
jgi:hypothetical protein